MHPTSTAVPTNHHTVVIKTMNVKTMVMELGKQPMTIPDTGLTDKAIDAHVPLDTGIMMATITLIGITRHHRDQRIRVVVPYVVRTSFDLCRVQL